jgi:hypothetical protein
VPIELTAHDSIPDMHTGEGLYEATYNLHIIAYDRFDQRCSVETFQKHQSASCQPTVSVTQEGVLVKVLKVMSSNIDGAARWITTGHKPSTSGSMVFTLPKLIGATSDDNDVQYCKVDVTVFGGAPHTAVMTIPDTTVDSNEDTADIVTLIYGKRMDSILVEVVITSNHMCHIPAQSVTLLYTMTFCDISLIPLITTVPTFAFLHLYNTQVTGQCGKSALRNQVTEYRVDKLQLVYSGKEGSSENLLSNTTNDHGLPVTYSTDRFRSSFDLGEWCVAVPRDLTSTNDDTATLKLQDLVYKKTGGDEWPIIPCSDLKVKLTHHTQTVHQFTNVKIHKQHDKMSGTHTVKMFDKAWLPLDDNLSVQPNSGDYLIRLSVANIHGEPVTDVDLTITSMFWGSTRAELALKYWDRANGYIWVILPAAACIVTPSTSSNDDDAYTVDIQVFTAPRAQT